MEIFDIPDPLVRAKVVQAGPCWIWTGSLNDNGYGHFVRKVPHPSLPGLKVQKKSYVHRYVFSTLVKAIPPRHEVHHTCYNRPCCNPEHLVALTHEDNLKENRQLA